MMKYLSASNQTVGFLNSLILLGTIYGLYTYEFSVGYMLLTLVFYFIYSGIGIGITMHRYYTHKSFEFKYKFLEVIFTYMGLLAARGSIIGWVHVHREHHAYSDTEKDPHIKNMSFLKLFFPYLSENGKNINKFLIRDLLNKNQLNINKYYIALVLTPVLLLSMIDFRLAFFCWFLPVFLTNLIWNIFFWLGHNKISGYQTYETNDNSTNSWIFALLTFGEGWHNNHHKSPKNYSNRVNWYEFDLLGSLIHIIKK